MDPIFGGALALGGSLVSGLFGSNAQDKANQQNMQLAQNQMDFQERMSNTAYQRASSDMQKAGLNPMMMFGSGSAASSPGGSSATMQASNPMAGLASIKDAVSTATQMKVQNATVDNLVQQNANLKVDNINKNIDSELLRKDLPIKDATYGNLIRAGGKIVADTNNAITAGHVVANEATRSDNENEYRSTPSGKVMDQIGLAGRKASDALSPVSSIISSAKGVKSLTTPTGKQWRPPSYFDDSYADRVSGQGF